MYRLTPARAHGISRGPPPEPESKSYSGDYELDHVTYTQKYGTVPGHIPDYYVNFGNPEAPQVGVPPC